MASLQPPWATRTRFVSIPGAPRETHGGERACKRCIRQRKPALCSRTAPSADIASVLPRVLATCLSAGGPAWESVVALHEPRAEVLAAPAAWFPGP
jgi:hypothetical protein